MNCLGKFDLHVEVAPTASGKTTKMSQWALESEHDLIVFVAPLRSICMEFSNKMGSDAVFLSKEKFNKTSTFPRFLVLSAESIDEDFFIFLKSRTVCPLIVLDEIHLFYLWGESFRFMLKEFLYLAYDNEVPILALTATLSKKVERTIFVEQKISGRNFSINRNGNKSIKRLPHFWIEYPTKHREKMIKKLILLARNERVLLFCQYKREVEIYTKKLKESGLNVFGYIGGKIDHLEQELTGFNTGVIVATTVLSHGVNLPSLAHLFISYIPDSEEFFWQMVGRAGRKGESYNLFLLGHSGKRYPIQNHFEISLFALYSFANIIENRWKLWKERLKDYYYQRLKQVREISLGAFF